MIQGRQKKLWRIREFGRSSEGNSAPELLFDGFIDEQDHEEADKLRGNDLHGIAQWSHIVVQVDTIKEKRDDHDGNGG